MGILYRSNIILVNENMLCLQCCRICMWKGLWLKIQYNLKHDTIQETVHYQHDYDNTKFNLLMFYVWMFYLIIEI